MKIMTAANNPDWAEFQEIISRMHRLIKRQNDEREKRQQTPEPEKPMWPRDAHLLDAIEEYYQRRDQLWPKQLEALKEARQQCNDPILMAQLDEFIEGGIETPENVAAIGELYNLLKRERDAQRGTNHVS